MLQQRAFGLQPPLRGLLLLLLLVLLAPSRRRRRCQMQQVVSPRERRCTYAIASLPPRILIVGRRGIALLIRLLLLPPPLLPAGGQWSRICREGGGRRCWRRRRWRRCAPHRTHDALPQAQRPRAAAPTTLTGRRSPFDESFDPFWGAVNEAGIPVVIHAGDSGWATNGYADEGFGATFTGGWKPSVKSFGIERAAGDFVITSIFEKLFDRFPNLRLASIENGSTFLADVFAKLRSTDKKMPGYFTQDPTLSLQQHWWINPFWEDDINEVVDLMGPTRVLFGSDWPHIEGMPEPLDYVPELAKLSEADRRRVLLDNVAELNTLRPA